MRQTLLAICAALLLAAATLITPSADARSGGGGGGGMGGGGGGGGGGMGGGGGGGMGGSGGSAGAMGGSGGPRGAAFYSGPSGGSSMGGPAMGSVSNSGGLQANRSQLRASHASVNSSKAARTEKVANTASTEARAPSQRRICVRWAVLCRIFTTAAMNGRRSAQPMACAGCGSTSATTERSDPVQPKTRRTLPGGFFWCHKSRAIGAGPKFRPVRGRAMVITLGFLISFAAGWSIVAADALFRAEERPGIFRGTPGMILLLVVAGVGGLTIAHAFIWVFQSLISAAVLVVLAGGLVLGRRGLQKAARQCRRRRQPDDGRACSAGPALWPGLDRPAPGGAQADPATRADRARIEIVALRWTSRGVSAICARLKAELRGFLAPCPAVDINRSNPMRYAACRFSFVTTMSTKPSRR